MSRLKDNYENSRAGKLEAWFHGDLDPMDGQLEVKPLSKEEFSWDKYQYLDSDKDRVAKSEEFAQKKILKRMQIFYDIFAVVLCLVIIASMIWMIQFLPGFGNPDNPVNNEVSARYIESGIEETGAVNFVTGMILDYRAFDTFGESCVLFIAAICVQILLRLDEKSSNPKVQEEREKASNDRVYEPGDDIILKKVACFLVPLLFIFGIYIILNGHLSPGGGFSGGAVIGAGLILYQISFGYSKIERFFTAKTFRVISLSALIFYCVAKSYSFYTGANHLESFIPMGTPGNILSSGLILPLNICVGLVVACTMYAFYTLFRKGDF